MRPQTALRSSTPVGAVVLFDGHCLLCQGAVGFIIDRDPDRHFVFATLESAEGRRQLERVGLSPGSRGTMVLIEGGRAYLRSTAVLRVALRLRGAWRALALLLVVPPFLRDDLYDRFASIRYRIFGRSEECRIGNADFAGRFLVPPPTGDAGTQDGSVQRPAGGIR